MTAGAARCVALWILLGAVAVPCAAQGEGVASTLHNLSASGPGEIRAISEEEICKFCHIPHSAVVPAGLWARELSSVEYRTPTMALEGGGRAATPQPDGSSRLCLSCHDGTIALGEIAGEPRAIAMGGASRLGPGRSGFLGTDLSGSHPISFVVPSNDQRIGETDRDMGLRPLSLIRGVSHVALDANGKMQCTTCHDPHRDDFYKPGVVPRFWVSPSVEEVCLTCHDLQ